MAREQGQQLATDLEKFSNTWIANPAAKLDYARLVERVLSTVDPFPVREWVKEEKRTARSLGVGNG